MKTAKLNILLIDDEPLVLEMFAYVLRGAGFRVKTALSAEEGLKLFNECRIDILVSDVYLGAFDGFDLADALRRRSPLIPVVLITGKPNEAHAERAERAGYSYLCKPVALSLLVETVGRAIKMERSPMKACA